MFPFPCFFPAPCVLSCPVRFFRSAFHFRHPLLTAHSAHVHHSPYRIVTVSCFSCTPKHPAYFESFLGHTPN